jgi:hypothetical protein
VAVLTRCSAPAHLAILGEKQGLPALDFMDVALYRSQASRRVPAVDALFEQMVQTLGSKT